jgi:energy-coupling factor transporter ATP-binding protein EcfA2
MQVSDSLKATITREVGIIPSPRVLQLRGLFDVPPAEKTIHTWEVNVNLPPDWNVGLIVGPSGSGKSTMARQFWPEQMARTWDWPEDRALLDGFPKELGIKDITGLLCSVGFSSPPSWLKPFHVLSNGEQFRVTMARTLAELPELAVVDEFTSVVDRDVAKIASAAVQKAVRRRKQKFVAVTCHLDVAEWLEPDWVYQPHTGEFVAGRSLRRPKIELEIARVHRAAWGLFQNAHYLTAEHHRSAYCFVGFAWGRPAVYCSVIHFPHPVRPGWKEHRTVCLPDYQGVGLGNALSEYVASLFVATGKPYRDTTAHPGHVQHRIRSHLWKCVRSPGLNKPVRRRGRAATPGLGLAATTATDRLTTSFEYIGPVNHADARAFRII